MSKHTMEVATSPPVNDAVSSSVFALRFALAIVACLAGAAVLVQEILAAGWMAPLYGSGLDVWATVLSISLTSLALGAWFGRPRSGLSDSRTSLIRACAGVLIGAACMHFAMAWIVRVSPQDPPALWMTASILLGAPLAAWGAASPWLVQGYASTGTAAGRAAGAMYAVGTMGSASGALVAGLFLIPQFGLVLTTTWIGIALATGVVATALLGSPKSYRLIGAALLVMGLAWFSQTLAHNTSSASIGDEGDFGLRTIERVDSFFGRHEVLEDDVSRYLLVDGVLQTSAPVFAVGPSSPGDIVRSGNALELAIWMRPSKGHALVIGLGGGAFPSHLKATGWDVTAVEIDPHVVDLARRHFALDLPVTIADGRTVLNRTTQTFDLIVLDVYRGEHLPGHLFTEEAFDRMRACLGEHGLLALNLIGSPKGPDVLAVLRNAKHAFKHIGLFAPDKGQAATPMTLFASNASLEHESSRDRAVQAGVDWPEPLDLDETAIDGAARIRDHRNPLATLRRGMARMWRERSLLRFSRTK